MSDLLRVAATAALTTLPCQLHSASLRAGVDAATAVIRSNGASGTILLELAAAIGETATWSGGCPQGAAIPLSLHVTLTGTAPSFSAEVTR